MNVSIFVVANSKMSLLLLENYQERSVNGKPDFLLIITSEIHLSLNLLSVWCTLRCES